MHYYLSTDDYLEYMYDIVISVPSNYQLYLLIQ